MPAEEKISLKTLAPLLTQLLQDVINYLRTLLGFNDARKIEVAPQKHHEQTLQQLQQTFVQNLGSLLEMYSDSEAYNVKDRNAKTEAAMCVTSMLLDFPSGRGEDGLTATQYANTLAKNYKHRISDENLPGFVDGLVILFKRFDKDRAAIMNHSHKIFQSSKPDDTTSTHSTLTARY